MNNILRLEDRLLVTPRPLNAPLPRANASPLRIPVYDENRRPIPYMFRDRITGKISYEPPEPTAKTPKIALTTTSAADDWFNALTNPPPRRGLYRCTNCAKPTKSVFVRWFDGTNWFGSGIRFDVLTKEQPPSWTGS